MHAPEFWTRDGLAAHALAPLAAAYGFGRWAHRTLARPTTPPIPVICVGALTVGGAGKTPTALALADRLVERGLTPHFLSRGYRGRAQGPVRVDPAGHDAVAVGDEPLLLAARAPTWVARDRRAGIAAAAAAGARLVIMDDGLQNPHLTPSVSILVVDGAYGFGNRRVLPAGPLREPLESALARVAAVVRLGPDAAGIGAMLPPDMPVLGARLAPAADAPEISGRRVLAFAAIGRPAKFFVSLREGGARLVGCRAFPDHHRYQHRELEEIRRVARDADALCMTTAKDFVRIPREWRAGLNVYPIEVVWDRVDLVDRILHPIEAASGPLTEL